MTVIDGSLARVLKHRRLFLSLERNEAVEIVYVCVDDGLPGGFPIGHVIATGASGAGTWSAYARARPGRVFANDQVATGLLSVGEAVGAVLDHARYGDVMFALEQQSGTVVTYIAEVHRDYAAHLAALDEPEGITHLGNGTVRFTSPAVAYLRSLPERLDCRIDGENRIRLAGESYPLIREIPHATVPAFRRMRPGSHR
ncbi:hypothetical protein [Streptomyces olivochromogenes]|uniref:hypothetical protein n=1 Tax=Streptomyces olivochromogenes TaxID=1963 RepID=UPI0036CF839C